MNYKKLENNVSALEQELKKLELNEDLLTDTEKEFANMIISLSDNKVSPADEDGKKIINIGNMIRKLGSKLLNLLKIEFSVSFAGVTIIHFQIPKIDNNLEIRKEK